MAAYARTPSALTWLRVNHLINGLHKQISWKNCLYADNLYFTLLLPYIEGVKTRLSLSVKINCRCVIAKCKDTATKR